MIAHGILHTADIHSAPLGPQHLHFFFVQGPFLKGLRGTYRVLRTDPRSAAFKATVISVVLPQRGFDITSNLYRVCFKEVLHVLFLITFYSVILKLNYKCV